MSRARAGQRARLISYMASIKLPAQHIEMDKLRLPEDGWRPRAVNFGLGE